MTPAELRAAVVTALTGTTTAQNRVLPERVDSIGADLLAKSGPVLCVYSIKRTDRRAGRGLYDRTEVIAVEGYATGLTDTASADARDTLEEQVRDALLTDTSWLPVMDSGERPTLGDIVEASLAVEGLGARVSGFGLTVPVSYRVTYQKAIPAVVGNRLDIDVQQPDGGHETKERIDLAAQAG